MATLKSFSAPAASTAAVSSAQGRPMAKILRSSTGLPQVTVCRATQFLGRTLKAAGVSSCLGMRSGLPLAGSGAGAASAPRRGALVVVGAAKKGKKDEKKKKGPGGLLSLGVPQKAEAAPAQPWTSGEVIMHSLLLIDSYFRATGKPLFAGPVEITDAARVLYEAPFMLMSHGTEEDPIFNYGNAAALSVFERDWASFTQLPSRKSAADAVAVQAERDKLIADGVSAPVPLDGVIRVSATGRKWMLKSGVLWPVRTPEGELFGQAAMFSEWLEVDEEGKPLVQPEAEEVEGDAKSEHAEA